MATKKIYKKEKLVTSIDDLVKNKYKPIVLVIQNNNLKYISFENLKVLSLHSVNNFIENKRLYYATIIEEQVIRKSKPKTTPKAESNITGCKASLNDVYRSIDKDYD